MKRARLLWLVVVLWWPTPLLAGRQIAAHSDTIAPDYSRAVNLFLLHQFDQAEQAFLSIVSQRAHPNREAAQVILTIQLYLRRCNYAAYVRYCDSTKQQLVSYAFARRMLAQPASSVQVPADSLIIPFTLKKKGHVVVALSINGQARRFVVDTGAELTLVSKRLANHLALPTLAENTVVNSLGQALASSVVWIDSLQLGPLHINNLPALTASIWGSGIDGLLGWDVLKHWHVSIDYAHHRLVLRKPTVKTAVSRTLLGGSRPLVVVRHQSGNYLTFFLDTGSNGRISLSPNGLTKIGAYQVGRRLGMTAGVGGKWRISREKNVGQTDFIISDQKVSTKRTRIRPADEWISGVVIDGIIGSRQFVRGRLTLDYTNSHYEYTE